MVGGSFGARFFCGTGYSAVRFRGFHGVATVGFHAAMAIGADRTYVHPGVCCFVLVGGFALESGVGVLMSAENRKALLYEAAKYVTKDRNSAYGEPEDNFQAIADIWNAQGYMHSTDRPINATDVALMMAGLKLARLKHNPEHKDSWVDGMGYLACGGDIAIKPAAGGEALGMTEDAVKAVNDMYDRYEKALVPDLPIGPKHPVIGWVSSARCGSGAFKGVVLGSIGARPHAGHPFGGNNELWCDGYVASGNYGVGQPKPRPIKDSPQA